MRTTEVFGCGPEVLDSGASNLWLRPVLGTRNVLLLDGAEHLRRRKLVLPPFHGERMRAYEDLIREATRRELATWPVGAPVATLPRMHAITLRVVLRAVFGVEEGPARARRRRVGRRGIVIGPARGGPVIAAPRRTTVPTRTAGANSASP
jgi:cytochrome P450